jgi:hypothetical protein
MYIYFHTHIHIHIYIYVCISINIYMHTYQLVSFINPNKGIISLHPKKDLNKISAGVNASFNISKHYKLMKQNAYIFIYIVYMCIHIHIHIYRYLHTHVLIHMHTLVLKHCSHLQPISSVNLATAKSSSQST